MEELLIDMKKLDFFSYQKIFIVCYSFGKLSVF